MSVLSICYCILCTFFVEWIGFYSLYLGPKKQINTIIYSIFNPLEFSLIGAYFYSIIEIKKQQKYILIIILIVVLTEITGSFFKLSMFRLLMIAYFFSSVFSLFYLKKLLDEEANILQNPNFWIVTGILFFNAGFFFLSGFVTYVSQRDLQLAQKLFSINHLLNIIYYSLITYGFICQRNLAKSSL
jgi:hypothetical protein